MHSDRNLLTAVTALRAHLLTADQFKALVPELPSLRDRPLISVLMEREWLTESDCDDLNWAVESQLSGAGGNVRAVLEGMARNIIADSAAGERELLRSYLSPTESGFEEDSLTTDSADDDPGNEVTRDNSLQRDRRLDDSSDAPDNSDESGLIDVNVDCFGETREFRGAGSEYLPVETIQKHKDARSRYTLTRIEGRGGLGQVWLARDTHLRREVALKEILPDKENSDRILRLIKEAQITGQLEHPNIIPIYELNQNPDSKDPFYTMRFLRGDTLHRHIRNFHKAIEAGSFDVLAFRKLITDFISVCEALAYAHTRGVIHRDLKPQNVMIGGFGEVLVLDWGLATLVHEVEPDVDTSGIQLQGLDDLARTQEGQVLGTPSYMAPEQADGRRSLMDHRTDVYGLGAMLYCILTGHSPHSRRRSGRSFKDTTELLASISRGDFQTPLETSAWVPGALNDICLKAMARQRERRYQTASELADDLRRWLADEPVSCHREPLTDRAFRWLRKHRSQSLFGFGSLVLIAVVSTVAAIQINKSRALEIAAREDADRALSAEQEARTAESRARQESLRRMRQSRDIVDRSLTGFSEVLNYFPEAQPVRAELLLEAARELEQFASEDSSNPEIQEESGLAWLRVGDVRLMLDQTESAQAAMRSAAEIFEALAGKHPEALRHTVHLAECLDRLAWSFTLAGTNTDEARRLYGRAETLLTPLASNAAAASDDVTTSDNDADRTREVLAAVLVNHAQLAMLNQELDAATGLIGRARTVLEAAVQDAGDDQDLADKSLRQLALAHGQSGQIAAQSGDHAAAQQSLRAATTIFDGLAERHPEDRRALEGLAGSLVSSGSFLMQIGQDKEAHTALTQAQSRYDVLLAARPGIPAYEENQAVARTALAQLLFRTGNAVEARALCLQAFETLTRLTNSPRPHIRFHEEHAMCAATLGMVLRETGEADTAIDVINSALEEYAMLLEKVPGVPRFQRSIATGQVSLGRTLLAANRVDEAVNVLADALTGLESLLDESPGDQVSRDALIWCCYHYGSALLRDGQTTEADRQFARCIAERQQLMSEAAPPEHASSAAWVLLHCPSDKFRDAAQALSLVSGARARVPLNARYWSLQAECELAGGDHNTALRSSAMAAGLRTTPHPTDFLIQAIALAETDQPADARAAFNKADQAIAERLPSNPEVLELRDRAARLMEKLEPDRN